MRKLRPPRGRGAQGRGTNKDGGEDLAPCKEPLHCGASVWDPWPSLAPEATALYQAFPRGGSCLTDTPATGDA